jgi:rubredoxin
MYHLNSENEEINQNKWEVVDENWTCPKCNSNTFFQAVCVTKSDIGWQRA